MSYQDPVSYLMRALAIDEQVLGPEHPHTITIQENYAALLLKMNRTDEAFTLLHQAQTKRAENGQTDSV